MCKINLDNTQSEKKTFYQKKVAQLNKLRFWSFVGAQFRRIKDRRLKEPFDQVRSFRTKNSSKKNCLTYKPMRTRSTPLKKEVARPHLFHRWAPEPKISF